MIINILRKLAGWRGYAVAGAAGALVMGVVVGVAQEWRLGVKIADCQRDQAQAQASAATVSLSQLTADLQGVAAAARRASETAEQLPAQIGIISKALKDAKPLPAGCRPDADRVRNLTDAVHTAKRAAAGQPARGAVPADTRPAAKP
ncbi:hypothetical protein [Bordetella sp. BOR01]|uniref:hypothetical protein n=1 Tax=Bordetella sp. BOR01 TaxID=2854779 RepID=UPI001C47A9B4|nr:hypothetical protein [Bordetella sp. BOR01]MBV7482537.1 hypothetical protein [Bordetella sp. BOR01]